MSTCGSCWILQIFLIVPSCLLAQIRLESAHQARSAKPGHEDESWPRESELATTRSGGQQKSHPCGWRWIGLDQADSPSLWESGCAGSADRVQSRQPVSNRRISSRCGIKSFILALSYFCRKLPSNYRRRYCVSQPSSRWIGVGPQCHEHQEIISCSQKIPENCIDNGSAFADLSESKHTMLPWAKPSVGQALGLLVLLRFTHCCAST